MVRLREVTDPGILKQLEGQQATGLQEVTDPNVLSQLEGTSSLSAGDVVGGAIKNLPGDVWGVAKSLFEAAKNPRAVVEGMSDVGAGAISKMLPDWAFKEGEDVQVKREQYEGAAGQFGQHYADRYGGVENIKRSIAEHPAETFLDVATLAAPIKSRIPGLKIGGSGMTDEMRTVANIAKEKGLPLSPSSLNPSKTAKVFEWASDQFLPGKWWIGKKREQLATGLQGMFDDAIERLPIKTDKTQAGVTLKKALDKETYYGEFLNKLDDMASKTGELSGEKPAILMDNTAQLLSDMQNMKFGTGGESIHAWLGGLAKEGTAWTPETIKKYQSLINTKLRAVAGGKPLDSVPVNKFVDEGGRTFIKESGTLDDIRTAMFDALKSDIKEAYPSLRQAQDFYTVFGPSAVKKSPFLQNVMKQSRNKPWAVVDDIFKSNDFGSIDTLKSELTKFDPDAWKVIQNRFVENVFDSSMIQTADEMGQMFSPGKFIKNFDRYENVIKKYSPESFQNMKELRDVSATAMKDLSKKNANLMDLAVSGGLSGAGGIIGSAGVAVPNTFSFMMAKSMMNPTGWAKKWLTEGIKFSPSNAIKRSAQTNVLQIGGRNAFQEEDE